MKRPDIFYCLTSANQQRFCKAFGLIYSSIDYQIYWHGVIGRLKDCSWWAQPTPRNAEEHRISEARAAFLDSIYYEGGTME